MIKVSIGITLESAIKENYFNQNRFVIWRGQLNERAESLEEKLLKILMQDKPAIKKEEFVNIVIDNADAKITDPCDIRTLLEHTSIIPKKFMNPFKNMTTRLTT